MELQSVAELINDQTPMGKPGSRKPPLPKPEPTIKLRPALLSEERPSVTEVTTEFLEASEARAKATDTAPQNE